MKAFDKLYVYYTLEGKRVIEMNPNELQDLQMNVLSALWDKLGLDFTQDSHDSELESKIDSMMDGDGWIDQAKKLGLIRKRTKKEREEEYQEIDSWLSQEI